MSFNKNKYSVVKKAMFGMAKTEGFDLNVSTDGEWGYGDRGRNKNASDFCASDLPSYAPQAAKDFLTANGYLDHEHCLMVVNTVASAVGASDGHSAPLEV